MIYFNKMLFYLVAMITVVPAQSAIFNIVDFGAKGDGTTENAEFIQAAINMANSHRPGTVLVPEGTFLSGSIEIKSGVTLQLEKGATIKGTTDYEKYQLVSPGYQSFLTRSDLYPERVFIYAKEANDVAIIGSGTIDGNGKDPLLNFGTGFDTGGRLKSINQIRFIKCRNVRIAGNNQDAMLAIKNSNHWALQLLNCDGVHIQYIYIHNIGGITPDGLPICDSRDVMVEDCLIESGDDALTLKNGSPEITVSNITIKRTVLSSLIHPFLAGSPQSFGPFRNIKLIDCTFRALQNGNSEGFGFFVCNGGGSIDSVLVQNCTIDGMKMPFGIYIGNILRMFGYGRLLRIPDPA